MSKGSGRRYLFNLLKGTFSRTWGGHVVRNSCGTHVCRILGVRGIAFVDKLNISTWPVIVNIDIVLYKKNSIEILIIFIGNVYGMLL